MKTRTASVLAALTLSVSSGAAPTFASGVVDDTKIDHAGLVKDLFKRHGVTAETPEEFSLERFLDGAFLRARIGLFEVSISVHAATDKRNGGDYAQVLTALLDAQGIWLDWLGEKAPGVKDARKDLATLQRWAKGVRGDRVAELGLEARGDLFVLLKARKDVLEAKGRFAEYMAKGTALGLDRQDELVEPVLIAPTRREFIEILSLFGWMQPDQQYVYWTDDVGKWTNTYFNDVTLLTLRFAYPDGAGGDAFGGLDMNARTPTGMQQQVVQLCANALVDNYFGSRIGPSLAGALAVNLVVDQFTECNTRVDGDLRTRRTEAREQFIPGGNPDGGYLPPILADSRWRAEQGADRFVVALQAAQQAGANDAKREKGRLQHFELQNDAGSRRSVLSGPFLGARAEGREEVVEPFYWDSMEFFRSYRTCFVYWLQHHGERSKKKANEAYARFLTALASEGDQVDLESAIQGVYGKPLSAEMPDKNDLEGSFLLWLSKQ